MWYINNILIFNIFNMWYINNILIFNIFNITIVLGNSLICE